MPVTIKIIQIVDGHPFVSFPFIIVFIIINIIATIAIKKNNIPIIDDTVTFILHGGGPENTEVSIFTVTNDAGGETAII